MKSPINCKIHSYVSIQINKKMFCKVFILWKFCGQMQRKGQDSKFWLRYYYDEFIWGTAVHIWCMVYDVRHYLSTPWLSVGGGGSRYCGLYNNFYCMDFYIFGFILKVFMCWIFMSTSSTCMVHGTWRKVLHKYTMTVSGRGRSTTLWPIDWLLFDGFSNGIV